MKRVRRATYRPGQSKMSLSENEQYKQVLKWKHKQDKGE